MVGLNNFKVRNFKSIKSLDVNCKKLNVFIGEPNAGKSNILEALGIASWYHEAKKDLFQYVRANQIYELFKDHIVDRSISIEFNNIPLQIKSVGEEFGFGVEEEQNITMHPNGSGTRTPSALFSFFHEAAKDIRFYRFNKSELHNRKTLGSLESPHGQNLFRLIISRKDIQDTVRDILKEFGLKLSVNSNENKFEAVRDREGILINYSYSILSDTVRAFIFYTVALLSNKNAIIVLEEPEEKNYPFYADRLAEMIAKDESNQFFIVTHNPYFLETLINKSRKIDLSLNYVYMKKFETRVRQLKEKELQQLRQGDIFYNLQHLNR